MYPDICAGSGMIERPTGRVLQTSRAASRAAERAGAIAKRASLV